MAETETPVRALTRIDDPTVEIRAWMVLHGLRVKDVSDHLGLSGHAPVSWWLKGQTTSARIENYFRSVGCPEKYLAALRSKRQEYLKCQKATSPR
ncbi:hypothetical protein DENIS_3492 [Desulfonema ishimotonii]|uniref:Uncharacterized protein n=1 Tax=Desulfonema ishimotonii TaxID=45657 RepID=A0A401FZY9_9BACT|nr:hypothetical protein [Desulfonema ishimotonii]GBC62520.1 hypothetical protein DENIS_3492 [Desulfonema ishimotonii]